MPWIINVALKHKGDECLRWPFSTRGGRRGEQGYPALTNAYGHRVLCEMINGPAPSPEHEAEHLCGDRLCMNPRHIVWATHKENCARRTEHGTQTIGERHPGSVLSEEDVLAIRAAPTGYGTGRALAKKYGVCPATICLVRKGKNWTHVK